MIVGIPKERFSGERRVAGTPESVAKLIKLGHEVWIESGAGLSAQLTDAAYVLAGARVVVNAREIWAQANVVLKVRPPLMSDSNASNSIDEVALCQRGQLLLCLFFPSRNPELLTALASRGVSLLALDQVPRITRAQKMDALSAMANVAGYRAVVEAAHEFDRFFTGQVTAAGKVPPAKVLVIGAGVAGLAAIGAARALGAVVRAFDTRPVVKEQVESMGAQFLEVKLHEDGTGIGGYAKEMTPEFIAAEMALFKQQAREVDIIITTALIPGRPAPRLITTEMLQGMKPGSVVVDLAAEGGGNCELTRPNELVHAHGVSIIGYTDLPSRMAATASQLYATNLVHLLGELGKENSFQLRLEDEVIDAALVLHNGEVRWPRPASAVRAPASGVQSTPVSPIVPLAKGHATKAAAASTAGTNALFLVLSGLLLAAIGWFAPVAFLGHFTVFVLACIVGWQLVWNVTPALHTPLMSVTNAISGIILVGGMLKTQSSNALVIALAAAALLIATINVAGGFLVTQRMLKMFQK